MHFLVIAQFCNAYLHQKDCDLSSLLVQTDKDVRLIVSENLVIPDKLLETISCTQRINDITENKLVDSGSLFSECKNLNLIKSGHKNGFIAAATEAFANHYPLSLRPQHFWLMIL